MNLKVANAEDSEDGGFVFSCRALPIVTMRLDSGGGSHEYQECHIHGCLVVLNEWAQLTPGT